MFTERLREYRESLELTKKEMADKLEVSASFYNNIENGKKGASKNFMTKLVAESGKPEEFWLYGINDDEYLDVRENLKSTKKAIETIVDLGIVEDVDSLFKGKYEKGTLEELLIAALKADIECYVEKRNRK